MEMPREVASTHLALSAQDLRFRQIAWSDPNFLDHSRFEVLSSNQDLLRYRLQPWPTFVAAKKLEEIRAASLIICNLVRSIPQRIFGNDPEKICEMYKLSSPQSAEIVLAPPNGIETSIARGDLIDTRSGLKCIEFNFTPNICGWETSILVGRHMAVPATAEFVQNMGVPWSYTHTIRKFFLYVIEDVRSSRLCDDGELNVVFLFAPAELRKGSILAVLGYLESELAGALEEAGLQLQSRIFLCRHEDLIFKQGGCLHGLSRIHAVVEFTSTPMSSSVYQAYKAGAVSLFNGPIVPILSSKKNIALLSEHESSDVFSPEERESIRRHIPWSRRVVPGPVNFHGEKASMAELLDTLRPRLVLKKANSYGGKGVALGQFTPAAVWSELARTALHTGDYIVQEKLESLPYLYQAGDFGCEVHDVIWGPFIFGQTYGGIVLRMQPKAAGGPVNLSLTATEGIVFEI